MEFKVFLAAISMMMRRGKQQSRANCRKCIVASCIVMHEGKTLLINHQKLGVYIYPGGHVKPDEIPLETAMRETKEETGLDVEILGGTGMTSIPPSTPDTPYHWYPLPKPFVVMLEEVHYPDQVHEHFDIVYLTRPKRANQPVKGNRESKDLGWFSPEEIKRLELFTNVRAALSEAFHKISEETPE